MLSHLIYFNEIRTKSPWISFRISLEQKKIESNSHLTVFFTFHFTTRYVNRLPAKFYVFFDPATSGAAYVRARTNLKRFSLHTVRRGI